MLTSPTALAIHYTASQALVDDVAAKQAPSKIAINDRQAAYDPLSGLIRRSFAMLKASGASKGTGDQKEKEVIAKHLRCGVELHIFQESGETRDPDFFYFIVEANRQIAIRSRVDNGKIREVTATNTHEDIDDFLDVFDRMKRGSTPIRYLQGQLGYLQLGL
jgi:hypothetical protein